MSKSSLFDLTGRKVLLTGGGRGIGRTLAFALAEAGCDVALIARHLNEVEAVASDIRKLGHKALAFKADIAQKAEVQKVFDDTVKELGCLDVCVNNAGVGIHESAEDISEEHWDYVMDINLKGTFLCCQAAARHMIPQKRGSIINISSISGSIANIVPKGQAHYNASKAGIILLTKSLAVEWASYGIRVNTVSPGYIRIGEAYPMANVWESLTPMKRSGEPGELSGAVIYLASDASSFTTGSEIIVDGGYTAT